MCSTETVAPLTHPVQGGNVAPLCRLTLLYKRYKRGMGSNSSTSIETVVEEVTELNHVCGKRESRHGVTTHTSNDTDVMPLTPERQHVSVSHITQAGIMPAVFGSV